MCFGYPHVFQHLSGLCVVVPVISPEYPFSGCVYVFQPQNSTSSHDSHRQKCEAAVPINLTNLKYWATRWNGGKKRHLLVRKNPSWSQELRRPGYTVHVVILGYKNNKISKKKKLHTYLSTDFPNLLVIGESMFHTTMPSEPGRLQSSHISTSFDLLSGITV